MEANPILTEIRRTRDELARQAGYSVRNFMERVREREQEAKARGVKFVSLAKTRR